MTTPATTVTPGEPDSEGRFPSLDELDYQARIDAGGVTPSNTDNAPVEVYAPYAVEGNDTSAYVGVSAEYMTYANETDRPFRAESGTEKVREEAALSNPTPVRVGTTLEGEQTQGQGSTGETVYTATSGEGFVAPQAVPSDNVEPATESVTEPGSPASPSTSKGDTTVTPTPAVDASTPEVKPDAPVPPPPATTGKPTSPTGTGPATDAPTSSTPSS